MNPVFRERVGRDVGPFFGIRFQHTFIFPIRFTCLVSFYEFFSRKQTRETFLGSFSILVRIESSSSTSLS